MSEVTWHNRGELHDSQWYLHCTTTPKQTSRRETLPVLGDGFIVISGVSSEQL